MSSDYIQHARVCVCLGVYVCACVYVGGGGGDLCARVCMF